MAPRRNLKQPEPVETAAEAGYVSPPKKRKAQQDVVTNKSDLVKESTVKVPRLPRAAKSNKTEQAEVTTESEPAKKSRTTGKAAQTKKPPAPANQNVKANVKAKRGKAVKKQPTEENTEVDNDDNVKKLPAKKTRGKASKKAGMESQEKNEEELQADLKKNNTQEAAKETEEPPIKRGRSKKENIDTTTEKVTKTKAKAEEKKKADEKKKGEEPINATPKKNAKARGKAATNAKPPTDKNIDESVSEENEKTSKPTKAPAKGAGKKKKDMAAENVNNEEKPAKATKGRQAKVTKLATTEKSPAKKGRGRKAAATAEKEEADDEISTKEIDVDQKGLLHSTMITENNKHMEEESESEDADATKEVSSPTNMEEDETNSDQIQIDKEN